MSVHLEQPIQCLNDISQYLSEILMTDPAIVDGRIGKIQATVRRLQKDAEANGLHYVNNATREMLAILDNIRGREVVLTQPIVDALLSISQALKLLFIDYQDSILSNDRQTFVSPKPLTQFCELACNYRTDKAPGIAGHSYTPIYEQLFASERDKVQSVLEIGIGPTIYKNPRRVFLGHPPNPFDPDLVQICGASLRTWAAYFPAARVYGIDIAESLLFETDKIRTSLCDQSDHAQLRNFASENGPFDIIIDDGSHLVNHQIISLFALFDFVRPGGYYLIEDVSAKELFVDTFYQPSEAVKNLIEPSVHERTLGQIQYCANYSLNGRIFGYENPADDHLIVFRKYWGDDPRCHAITGKSN
jgi:hypothetical protein